MLIIADKYIPFLKGILEPYADIRYLEPEEITPAAIREADALLVRTRTKCNAALLDGSKVRFIATATIGYDHIDTEYCNQHGIFWTNSPGCNAQGVCDYLEEALSLKFSNIPSADGRQMAKLSNEKSTLGIVGVGHVGSLVAKMAEKKGYRVLLNDPPKEDAGDILPGFSYVSLDEIARLSDIITFHTPLTRSGKYPTWHICNEGFLMKCKPDVLIINAARGGILDEEAILKALETKNQKTKNISYIIDTWENEPRINRAMLDRAMIGTYHIAGYTLQGKINATNMCLDALCKYFSLPALSIPEKVLPLHPETRQGWIMEVDRQLRANPDNFEILRETYKLR